MSLSLVICILLAYLTWRIFYPGILSVDSLYTLREAKSGDISDVRSPFITLLLALILKAGGNIGTITLIQVFSGFLGLRRLIFSITKLYPSQIINREWIACLVILLVSSPLTPLPVYFATIWFDTWLVIILLWVVALLFELVKKKNLAFSKKDQLKIYLLVLLMTFAMFTRPNSSILYPALALAFFNATVHKSISNKLLFILALCPLILYLLFSLFQYRIIRVKRVHPERVSFALDLASMLTYDPIICSELSLPSCQTVMRNFPPEFIPGNGAIDHTLNQGHAKSEPGFVELITSSSLTNDLVLVVTQYPEVYLKVKLLNFLDYIRPRNQYYFQSFIHPNNVNLYFDTRFNIARNKLFSLLHNVYQHPFLKYFSFVHITWIIVNLSGIFSFLILVRKSPRYKHFIYALSIPSVYYFSFLVAMTASDFRFMYPSLVLTQVIFLTLFLQKLFIRKNFTRLSTVKDK